jgi:hypothetical protein
MNTNALHNLLNLALAVIAGVETFDWTSILSPSTAVTAAGLIGLTKLVINIYRDGLTGLIKARPPVK